jgi:hypothetical protein
VRVLELRRLHFSLVLKQQEVEVVVELWDSMKKKIEKHEFHHFENQKDNNAFLSRERE